MLRAYGSAFVTYARDELGFKTEMTYTLLSSRGEQTTGTGAMARSASTASVER